MKKKTVKNGREAFLVVCADGEITGKFGNSLYIVEQQAIALEVQCVCGGPHEIIRMVQSGKGRSVLNVCKG